jgi:hypothetical protein
MFFGENPSIMTVIQNINIIFGQYAKVLNVKVGDIK